MSLGQYLGAGTTQTLSLYHFEGNSNDSSGNGKNGTDTNTAYGLGYGNLGQGVLFRSGHDTQITFSANVTPVTIAFSVNAVEFYSGTSGWTLFRSTSPDHTIQGAASTGKILIYDATANRTANNTWVTGVWARYVFIYTTVGGNGYDIYLNGNFLERLTSNQVQVRQLGRSSSFAYYGSLDEVILDSTAWSAAQVRKDYTYNKGRFGII